jgi:hypothetical protein
MCVSRREFLSAGVALAAASAKAPSARAEIGRVETVAGEVYFHEGDLAGKGHCNNGSLLWVCHVYNPGNLTRLAGRLQ